MLPCGLVVELVHQQRISLTGSRQVDLLRSVLAWTGRIPLEPQVENSRTLPAGGLALNRCYNDTLGDFEASECTHEEKRQSVDVGECSYSQWVFCHLDLPVQETDVELWSRGFCV